MPKGVGYTGKRPSNTMKTRPTSSRAAGQKGFSKPRKTQRKK